MEKLRAGIDFILSSYKRTAAILFIGALTLAIPITITLVGQQQDIRQRAEEIEEHSIQGPLTEEALRSYCERCMRDEDDNFACGRVRDGSLRVSCREEETSSYAMCISCKISPSPSPIVCTQDVRMCPDGTSVTRTGPNCIFPACPTIPTPTRESCESCLAKGFSSICQSDVPYQEPNGETIVAPPTCGNFVDGIHCRSCQPTPTPTVAGSNCPLKPNGDANCDGKVNTDDFNIWKNEFLMGSILQGGKADFNSIGKVDTDDFNIWRDGFLSPQNAH